MTNSFSIVASIIAVAKGWRSMYIDRAVSRTILSRAVEKPPLTRMYSTFFNILSGISTYSCGISGGRDGIARFQGAPVDYPDENALAGHNAVADLLPDGAGGMAFLADLRHLQYDLVPG
jgi:hypothetical protein